MEETRICKLESCNNAIDSKERKDKQFCSDSCKNKYYNSLNRVLKQSWSDILDMYESLSASLDVSFPEWLALNYYAPKPKPKHKKSE